MRQTGRQRCQKYHAELNPIVTIIMCAYPAREDCFSHIATQIRFRL